MKGMNKEEESRVDDWRWRDLQVCDSVQRQCKNDRNEADVYLQNLYNDGNK